MDSLVDNSKYFSQLLSDFNAKELLDYFGLNGEFVNHDFQFNS